MTSITSKEDKLRTIEHILWVLIALILALQLHLQFVQKINWDEFYFLSLVYDFERGSLGKPLQTAHIHFFRWLKYINPNEVSQILAARCVMWLLQLGTLTFIFKTARRFMSRQAALFTLLAYLGFGFIFVHGTSFRADPIASFFMCAATYIFVVSKLGFKSLCALTVCLALGFLVTIKVIFYSPLFALLAVWRLKESDAPKALFIRLSLCAFVTVILIALGYALQSSLMPQAGIESSQAMLTNAGKTTLLSAGLFPRSIIIQQHFLLGIISTGLMTAGIIIVIMDLMRRGPSSKNAAIILAMGLPLLSLIIYRNAFPYYFAFIFPTAVLWAGYAIEKMSKMQTLQGILAALIIANVGLQYSQRLTETHKAQQATLEELHRMSPKPVNYIDRSAMLSSFPKSGFFMSSWGVGKYRARGEATFRRDLQRDIVPLIVNNSPEIAKALNPDEGVSLLLEEDQSALRDNYVQHWGHIWIAGKSFEVSQRAVTSEVLVPGRYKLTSQTSILINGDEYSTGAEVALQRGELIISAEQSQNITLRWAAFPLPPKTPAPTKPLFTTF